MIQSLRWCELCQDVVWMILVYYEGEGLKGEFWACTCGYMVAHDPTTSALDDALELIINAKGLDM